MRALRRARGEWLISLPLASRPDCKQINIAVLILTDNSGTGSGCKLLWKSNVNYLKELFEVSLLGSYALSLSCIDKLYGMGHCYSWVIDFVHPATQEKWGGFDWVRKPARVGAAAPLNVFSRYWNFREREWNASIIMMDCPKFMPILDKQNNNACWVQSRQARTAHVRAILGCLPTSDWMHSLVLYRISDILHGRVLMRTSWLIFNI